MNKFKFNAAAIAIGLSFSAGAMGQILSSVEYSAGRQNTTAESNYWDGVALERRGDTQGALAAYLAAGQSGNALAQKRLGDIYGNGKLFVERDYQTSLHWYERARKQGVDIPKPLTYSGVPPVSLR